MKKVVGFSIEQPGLIYSDAVQLLQAEQQVLTPQRSIEVIEILGQQAEGLRRLSKLDGAQELFQKTLLLARQSGVCWGECWSLWGLGSVFRARGAYRQSKRLFSAALTASKLAEDKRCALWSLAELSELDRIGGYLEKAIASHKYIRDEFYAMGDWKGVCWASLGLAQIYRLQRALIHSIVEFKRAQEIALVTGNIVGASWSVRGMAEIAKENGDYQTCEKLASSARSDFLAIGYKLGAAYALKTLAEATLAEGRSKEALTLAIQCRDEFLSCGERRGIGFALLTLGKVLLHKEEYNQAIYMLQGSKHYIAHPSGNEPNCFSPSVILRHVLDGTKRINAFMSNGRLD